MYDTKCKFVKKFPKLKIDLDLEILIRAGIGSSQFKHGSTLTNVGMDLLLGIKKLKFTKDKSSKEAKLSSPILCEHHDSFDIFVKNAIQVSLSTPIGPGFLTMQKCIENYGDWKNELKGSLLYDLATGEARSMVIKAN